MYVANVFSALIELQEEQTDVDTPEDLEFRQEIADIIALTGNTNRDVDMLSGQSSLTENASGARVSSTSYTPGTVSTPTETAPAARVSHTSPTSGTISAPTETIHAARVLPTSFTSNTTRPSTKAASTAYVHPDSSASGHRVNTE